MPEYKFTYKISGIHLTDLQRTRISDEIALAVTRTLLDDSPGTLCMRYEAEHPICGGAHRREDEPATDDESESAVVDPSPDDTQTDSAPRCSLESAIP